MTPTIVLPLVVVFASAFSKGIVAYLAALAEPEALAAIKLTLLVAAISVTLNLVFGVAAAWAIAKFEFRGKSGKDHSVSVKDRRLAKVVRQLEGLPGQQLFKYRAADGTLCPVDSDDVNAYIREAMGEQFSAKDFRTWAGTVSAARAFRDMDPPTSQTDGRRKITVCMKAVAGLLGNTPTVCRSSYVHPVVVDLYESGRIAEVLPGSETKGFEPALMKLLKAQ